MIVLRCAPEGQRETRIEIGPGARARALEGPATNRFVVCDATVGELAIAPPHDLALAGGELAKSVDTLEVILSALARAGIDRSGRIVAVGGGTIGDVTGTAAALWARGIAFDLVPTTLLAMVDSSVGGKTAINLPEGKNLAGAFWPPERVFIDPGWLTTLPDAEYRSGLGEVLKAAIGLDRALFELCERRADDVLAREPGVLIDVVERAIAAKIRVVEADFRERGARRLLNLGHTIGHALEFATDFAVPHGVAVARGIHFAIEVAVETGALQAADATRARALLERYGFAAAPLPPRAELERFVRLDKKRDGDRVHFVVPVGIGAAETRALELDALTARLA